MILAQCKAAVQSVDAYQKYKARATQQDSIQATQEALSKLANTLDVLSIYPAFSNYLSSQQRDDLQHSARQLANEITGLQRSFSNQQGELGQQGKLRRLQQAQAETFVAKVRDAWSNYAQPLVEHLNKRYILVKHLPSVQQNGQLFEEQLLAVRKIASSLPKQEAQVAEFHTRLQDIHNELERVGDLTPSQQQFLELVNQGNAKVAHITPELLQWLKTQGMDHRLSLKLL